eukprot:364353-Chlamydomonas_euryale.AAC.6
MPAYCRIARRLWIAAPRLAQTPSQRKRAELFQQPWFEIEPMRSHSCAGHGGEASAEGRGPRTRCNRRWL